MGNDAEDGVSGKGHLLASDIQLVEGVRSLSLKQADHNGRQPGPEANATEPTSLRNGRKGSNEDMLPVSTSSRATGEAAQSPRQTNGHLQHSPQEKQATASSPAASRAGSHRSSPSWEEKGKVMRLHPGLLSMTGTCLS